jgi:hypothetical protein
MKGTFSPTAEYAMRKGPITDFHGDNRLIWRVRDGHKDSGDSVQLQLGLMDHRRGQVPRPCVASPPENKL